MNEPFLDEILPPGASWSRACRRATALTLTDLDGGANVSALLYRADDPLERYCMPDTLKCQRISRLTAGSALHSDMGRVLASITHDTCGWHDTITGHATAPIVADRWGVATYQDHRNDWRRSARDGLLVELSKHGLSRRDLVANINFFSKVSVQEDGALAYVTDHSAPGDQVTVRFELDCLVVLCSVPHPLDPTPEWSARPVRLQIAAVPQPADDDLTRTACEQNERGFAATEAALR